MEVITAAVAWALASASESVPVVSNWLGAFSRRQTVDLTGLAGKLSATAKIYHPGSEGFEAASTRWSVLDEPTVNVVVVPGTENDVAETVIAPFPNACRATHLGLYAVNGRLIVTIQVQFANQKDIPFLAFGGAHGAITTLGKMDHGIEIYLNQLGSIEIASDGQTATFGGGVMAKNVTDALWAAGKQTGKSKRPDAYHQIGPW
jgi:hypothetical protein